VGSVARMGEMGNGYKIFVGNHLEDLGVDARIILVWILRKYGGKDRTGFIWFRIGTRGRLL